MLNTKSLFTLLRNNYSLVKQSSLYLKVKRDRKLYPLTNFYTGYLESGQQFVAFHNQTEGNPIKIADLLTCPFKGYEILVYDNSVECNLITDIKIQKNKVVLGVDIFNNVVRSGY